MSSLPPPPPPMNPGPPPGWGQWPPAAPAAAPGNHWQLYPNDHMGPAQGERAGFGARLGADLLDQLLYGLLSALFVGPAIAIGFVAFDDCWVRQSDDQLYCPPGAPDVGPLVAAAALGLVGLAVVFVLYVRALARTGQTWGRRIVGVKVVGERDGQPLGYGRAIGRLAFAGFISGQICYLGYLWMLWDAKQQTWHDKVVGSTVVRV